jgi:hypothetical protein
MRRGREDAQARFNWEMPRWRNAEADGRRLAERERRFRNSSAARQRGAIETELTIRVN